ncbi:MAG: aldo/keto reductase [Bacteroidales bacterium]|nr:aldo/keto reductase [Bacteroidales bacterium]
MNKKDRKKEIGRRDFLKLGSLAAISVSFTNSLEKPFLQDKTKQKPAAINPEWRNKQDGMVYRQLGKTGLMVSELVFGSERITSDNIRPIEVAIERGINYFDTAPQYGKGASETAIGKALNTPSKREKVFLATKISPYPSLRNRLYREIFDTLPSAKKESIQKRALEMRKESGIEKPGYFLVYWPGHPRQLDGVFLSDAMMEEYGEKVEGNPEFKKLIISSVEESLKRVGTDYFDILHCPHAATSPSEINNPFIAEAVNELKKQGKVRFLGFSTHHNMAALLNTAIEARHVDVVMLAYNVVNYGFMDHVIKKAKENNVGIIAMKAAMAVFTPYPPEQVPVPEWRIQKLNQIIPGEMKLPVKAYLWALQNPDLSAVVSGMTNEEMLLENLSVVGKKIELQQA